MNFNIFKRETTATPTASQAEAKNGGNFQENIVYANGEQSALTVGAFYRAVDVLSNSMSQMVMEYQKLNKAKDFYEQDNGVTRGRSLNYLLQIQPNPRMNANTFWKNVEQQRILRGNAYIYARQDELGEVDAIYLISPGCCTYNVYSNTYLVNDTINNIHGDFSASEIIHLRNTFSMDGGFTGVSTLKYAARTLNISATSDQLTLENAGKGGRVKMIIQQKQDQTMGFGRYSKDQMDEVASKLNKDIYEHDVSFLNGDATVNNISMNAVDMQILESRKFDISAVARFTGVPKAMLMDDSNSKYNTIEMATLELHSRTLAPRIREIENEFNSKLLGMNQFGSHRFHLCERNLFALDLKTQGEYNKLMLETGQVSVNELRKQNNMPKVENGDDKYVSCNVAPLGSAKLSGESTTTEEPTEPTGKGGEL